MTLPQKRAALITGGMSGVGAAPAKRLPCWDIASQQISAVINTVPVRLRSAPESRRGNDRCRITPRANGAGLSTSRR